MPECKPCWEYTDEGQWMTYTCIYAKRRVEDWVCRNCAPGVRATEDELEHQEQVQSLTTTIAELKTTHQTQKQKIKDHLLSLLKEGSLTEDQITQAFKEQ